MFCDTQLAKQLWKPQSTLETQRLQEQNGNLNQNCFGKLQCTDVSSSRGSLRMRPNLVSFTVLRVETVIRYREILGSKMSSCCLPSGVRLQASSATLAPASSYTVAVALSLPSRV